MSGPNRVVRRGMARIAVVLVVGLLVAGTWLAWRQSKVAPVSVANVSEPEKSEPAPAPAPVPAVVKAPEPTPPVDVKPKIARLTAAQLAAAIDKHFAASWKERQIEPAP